MIDLLVRLYQWSPLLGIFLQTALVLALTTLAGRGVLRALRQNPRRAGGPILLFSAALVATVFAALLLYLWLSGRSFEQAVIEWLTGIASAPVEELGHLRFPFVLGLTYAALYAVFSTCALLVAWLVGDPSGESVAREVESELGSSWVERFYKLAGFHQPSVQEVRFAQWCRPVVRWLRVAQWLSLSAAITGALSPPLWALLALVVEGLALNLVDPPTAPEEKRREEQAADGAGVRLKDPEQLVRALSIDDRGPELTVSNGGFEQGGLEHIAGRTRLGEESSLVRDALTALGIDGLFVHQEATSEALLDGKSVLLETPPLSGRRTLGDLFALRTVLVEGGTVLYLSPDRAESARRARAFAELSTRCNWRWAIHHHDLGSLGRRGIAPEVRPPQILFATAGDLHHDVCARHREWSAFLSRLSLIVAIDLDRYTGAHAASVAFVMRRLRRLTRSLGGSPRVLASVAPFGPDVLGHAEALMGTPFHVVGPESDSRGAPPRQIVVGSPSHARELHPAVGARGVAIACGYQAEAWDYDSVLTGFEQGQQVNQVLLGFGHAVIQSGQDAQVLLDSADALVVRLSAEKAALLHFFTRHVGQRAIGGEVLRAREVGARKERDKKPEERFAGFAVEREAKEQAPAPAEEGEEKPQKESVEESPPQGLEVELRADRAVSIWIPDDEPFARLLAQNPSWLSSARRHPRFAMGSKLVAARDATAMATRHLLAAATEAPLRLSDAARDYPALAIERARGSGPLLSRPIELIEADGALRSDVEVTVNDSSVSRFELTASGTVGRVLDRSDGSVVLETDRACLCAVAYPGRVLMVHGRRYRVLLPDEQPELTQGVVYAVPERRRTRTARIRELELSYEGAGSELRWGGTSRVRLHHPVARVIERVLGVRSAHPLRGPVDELSYEQPLVAEFETRAAVLALDGADPAAGHALAHLARTILPACVRHGEGDLDVHWLEAPEPSLVFIDRHAGEAGYARAVTGEVAQAVLEWCRTLLDEAQHEADCAERDGCSACVLGVLCQSPEGAPPGRRAARGLLDAVLGP